ncbi:MAG TPA: alpha/beta fold hydrolase [Solirubrobacteraceae bacterium]
MRRVALIAVALAIAACGGGGAGAGSDTARSTSTAARAQQPPAGPAPRLTVAHPCDNAKGFTCSTLVVPLDHSGRTPGDLRLAVSAADNADAPKGVLVALTGGPGQGGVDFVPRSRVRMRALLHDYRLVMFDQRGTGAAALRCPALQRAVGTSDLTVPPPGSVGACARTLGPNRRFYSTADTVADLEALRVALGADKLTLDGVSYGTFVAERYAMAHPNRVAKLVLDSVVPAAGLDALEVDGLRETARVLRAVCRAQHCPGDPAGDLAGVVRARHNGPVLDDTLVALSVGAPTFPGVLAALHEARAGHVQHLDRLVRVVRRAQRAPAQVLSQGLHAATLCADTKSPWGGAGAPLAGREAALRKAAAAAPDPAPYDRATIAGNGYAQLCLRWPPTPAPPAPRTGDLPPVPTLLLAGDRDLSTPLPWAREQAAHTPRGRLVVVHGAGHSVQSRAPGGEGRRAVRRFLLG